MAFRQYWPLLLLVLVPLLAVGKAVFTSDVIGAFSNFELMPPWNKQMDVPAWDVLQADSVLQTYAWRKLVLEGWAAGEVPLWNPYQLCGTPLLANSQSAPYYLPHVLFGVLRIPVGTAIDLLAWLHLAWAGLGIYKFARSLGASKEGAALSGIGFQLSPFLLGWTSMASVLTTVSWIPWCLCGTVLLMRDSGALRRVMLLAVAVGMLIMSGHLQFAAYGIIGSVILAIGLAIENRSAGSKNFLAFAALGLSIFFGGMISAPQLLPSLEYSQFSHRKNTPTEEGYQAYVGLKLMPHEAISRVAGPFAQGNPVPRNHDYRTNYAPALTRPGANFAESAFTVGPILLLGAIVALFAGERLRSKWPIFALVIVTLLFAMGTDLNRTLYFFVPGWSSTGSPNRILVLAVIGLLALAGEGLVRWNENPASKKEKAAIAVFGILIFAGMMLAKEPENGIIARAIEPLIAQNWLDNLMQVAIGAAAAIGIFVAQRHVSPTLRMALLAVAVIGFPAAIGALKLVRAHDPSFLTTGLSEVPTHERVAFITDHWSFTGTPLAFIPPNIASINRIHDVAGYDSLLHRDSVKLLHDINGGKDAAPPENGNMMFVKPGYDTAQLADAGVVKILMEPARTPGEPASDLPFVYVAGPGRASITPSNGEEANVPIAAESLNSVELKDVPAGKLILRDRNMPGWKAIVDGKEVPISGSMWREIDIESPAKSVKFEYRAPGIESGFKLSLIATLLATAIPMWGIFRQKSKNKQPE